MKAFAWESFEYSNESESYADGTVVTVGTAGQVERNQNKKYFSYFGDLDDKPILFNHTH